MSEHEGDFVEYVVEGELRRVELGEGAGYKEDWTLCLLRVFDKQRTLILRPVDVRCLCIQNYRRPRAK